MLLPRPHHTDVTWGKHLLWFIRIIRGPLTDHVDGGPPRPRPRVLLDGVVESGLTQLNGSHTDPEAQAEQPGHDRTHLLRTSGGGVKKKKKKYIMFLDL